jgi:hypothetical protein
LKTTLVFVSFALLLFAVIPRAGAEIIAGPMTNPANGHEYYLLAPGNWTAAEREAENLGGTLAIIRNDAEQKWVFASFGHDGDKERSLWIGLHRLYPGGSFVWVDGSPMDYVNWHSGQPDNGGGNENCVHLWAEGNSSGLWNDAAENSTLCAVVEVPFKSNGKMLNGNEKAVIGKWYESGKSDRPEWIAGTDTKLFEIYDGRAVRIFLSRQGAFYLANGIRGEILKDRLLWSNGTWWSRQPVGYEATNAPAAGRAQGDFMGAPDSIMAGPVTNPANGHEYFLLNPNTWTASEAAAERLAARWPSSRMRRNRTGFFPGSAIMPTRIGACGSAVGGAGQARRSLRSRIRRWLSIIGMPVSRTMPAAGSFLCRCCLRENGMTTPTGPIPSAAWWKCRANPTPRVSTPVKNP